jgi:outer membrane protein
MIAAGAAMVSVVTTAQAESKIGVVNFGRLLQESPQGRAATDMLRKEAEAKQNELGNLQASLKAKEDRLTKDGATMTADQRTRAEKELRDGNRDLQTKTTEFQDDLSAHQNEIVGRLQNELGMVVQNYAAAQKFDLVLAAEGSIVYATAAMDITNAVLATLPAVAAAPAAAAPKPATSAAPKPAAPAKAPAK